MVARRKVWQHRLTHHHFRISKDLRRHAGVAINLGTMLYTHNSNNNGDDKCVTAMRLFQEAVQTLMYVDEEEESGGIPSKERQKEMDQLLTLLSVESIPNESRQALFQKVASLYQPPPLAQQQHVCCHDCVTDGIPGLFHASSKLKGVTAASPYPTTSGLLFGEAFTINLQDDTACDINVDAAAPVMDDRQFIIPLRQCSKAALFNMGLIHYNHWGSPTCAMQLFDLAASLSKKSNPLAFDPVVMACLNNMAQIHLQHDGQPNQAMEMLSDALTRGNAALTTIYSRMVDPPVLPKPPQASAAVTSGETSTTTNNNTEEQQIGRRTRRLRRKLARTLMNVGHVLFFNCDYDAAMVTCGDALRLLGNMGGVEVAAVWYNMSTLYYHQGRKMDALTYLDKHMELAGKLNLLNGVQKADALHRKGQIMFEMGNLYECMKPLNETLRIRRTHLGEHSSAVAESLCLIGKVLQAREEYDFALNALSQCLRVQRQLSKDNMSLELAQTLMEVGRAYHSKGDLKASLEIYLEVADWTRKYFGRRHAFVARIDSIVGTLYLEIGEVEESLSAFEEAMQIRVEQGLPVDMNVVQDKLMGLRLEGSSVAPSA